MVPEPLDKRGLTRLVAQHTGRDPDEVGQILDATFEEIYRSLKRGAPVSLRNFGSFWVRPGRETWAFRFNPSQRLRKLFGWSSTYHGDL